MTDTTVAKIDSTHSPKGPAGQKYLACGKSMSMRLWENEGVEKDKTDCKRDYETIGFAIKGKAELHIEGQMVLLNAGDSWVVPKGASHHYKILEEFSAVESTSPPAELHDRSVSDKAPGAKEFFETSAQDAANVKTVEPTKMDSPEMQAKANTETKDSAEAKPEAKPDPQAEAKVDKEVQAGKEENPAKDKPSENKAQESQEVVAQIPRTESAPTSNSPEKEPQPAEHVDVAVKDQDHKQEDKSPSKSE
jgi:mannose-6-phosphate isomerase-like protein (cupin superfamily)